MLTFNDKTITYDENGNMTSMTNSCGKTTYTWNARNSLIAINGFNTDCSPLTASFKYDALNRRVEKTINGRTIQYLYDGQDIVQEIENGEVTANYLRTMNIDEPLLRVSPNAIRFYQMDALGSVIALTDETGSTKTQYTYDPFGNVTVLGEFNDNPYQYTGRENDGTGLYYYRARYYTPELHRFISEDPIRLDSGDWNFYAYVGNNPMNAADPLGLMDRYTWCKGKPGCKQATDKACSSSVQAAELCCKYDFDGCLIDIGYPACEEWEQNDCIAKYVQCLKNASPKKERKPLEPPLPVPPNPPYPGNPRKPYPPER